MMSADEKVLREVLGGQYFAVLSTVEQGLPYSSLVSFATADGLRALVFATGRSTRKYRSMRENPEVALLIDNRSNRPSDTEQATAVTAMGRAGEEIGDRDLLEAALLARHPQLGHFMEQPGSAVMVVRVREYIIAGFERTRRVVMSG